MGHDGRLAGLIGAGGAAGGRTVYLSGTSEIIGISSPSVTPTPGAIVFPPCNGVRLHAGPTNNGGDALLWFSQATKTSLADISDLVISRPRSAATPRSYRSSRVSGPRFGMQTCGPRF